MTATLSQASVAESSGPATLWTTPVGLIPLALTAKLLDRNRQGLARKAAAGTLDDGLTAVRIGSDWLFRRVDLERILGVNLDDVLPRGTL